MAYCDYSTLVAGILQSTLKKECNEDVLLKISVKFTRWRSAAPHLGLKPWVVDVVDYGRYDEEGKPYVILCRWKQLFGPLATNEKLIRGFLAAGRADLAKDVASELRPGIPKPASSFDNTPIPFLANFEDSYRPFHPTNIPQSTEQPHQQNRLVQNVFPEQQTLTRLSGLLQEALVLTSEEPGVQVVKRESIRKLRDHVERLEVEWKKNVQSILELRQEISQYKKEMKKQKKQLYGDELSLESKERLIRKLQDAIYQKEMELKQKKGEREDLLAAAKQQHKKRVTALETELDKARSELQTVTKEKNDVEKQFKEVYESMKNCEEEVERDKRKIAKINNENMRLKGNLQYAEECLDKERQEVKKLVEMERRNTSEIERVNWELKKYTEENIELRRNLECKEELLDKEKQEVKKLNTVVAAHRYIIYIMFLVILCITGVLLKTIGAFS